MTRSARQLDFVAAMVVAGVGLFSAGGAPGGVGAADAAEVVVPSLTPVAMNGKAAFDAKCASCHGANGAGTDKGPPLIHKIYEPSHHGDQAFWIAVRQGARGHHWSFGDMKPVDGLSDAQIGWIVRYVREVQRANGIE